MIDRGGIGLAEAPHAADGVEDPSPGVRGRLRPGAVVAYLEHLAIVGSAPSGQAVQIEPSQQDAQIDDEPGGERGAAARDSVAKELEARVEVVDRLDEVPLVEQRQPDVLLQQRISPRIATPSMQGEVDARRLLEEPKRLRGSRCASRLRDRKSVV